MRTKYSGDVNWMVETGLLSLFTEQIRDWIGTWSEVKPPRDEEVRLAIERAVLSNPRMEERRYQEKRQLVEAVFNTIRRDLDLLQPYAEDDEVSEIMVNGTGPIFIERNGRIEKLPIHFKSTAELEEIVRRLAGRVHREINEMNPIVDARMEDGSRVNAVYGNVALNGPILTIRKFPRKRINMEELLRQGSITKEAADFLIHVVQAQYNLFISGGTSSGKTTFLNVLSAFIPSEERVIVIEDSAELQIDALENVVRMETRNPNEQGKGGVTARQLIRTSLRMRPDRIIVGEVRGSEILDMTQAMNTGHDGSLSTGHGNSTCGMLRRLEAMYLTAADFPVEAIRGQIAEALDLMVHLGKMPDHSRKVLEITEVLGLEKGEFRLNPLFRYENEVGLVSTGNRLQNQGKLRRMGMSI